MDTIQLISPTARALLAAGWQRVEAGTLRCAVERRKPKNSGCTRRARWNKSRTLTDDFGPVCTQHAIMVEREEIF